MSTATITSHELTCCCDECKSNIVRQFKPFDIVSGNRDEQERKCCPGCGRPVWSKPRAGFTIWYCWLCSASEAKVTAIKTDPEQMFGFAEKEDQRCVYFHFFKRVVVKQNGGDYPIIFDLARVNKDEINVIPKEDDIILYHELSGDKGLKALWWCLKEEVTSAQNAINNRPTYRLVERHGRLPLSKLHEKPTYKILWEGKNLAFLLKEFAGFKPFDNGIMAKTFEVMINNQWVKCDDPTVHSFNNDGV